VQAQAAKATAQQQQHSPWPSQRSSQVWRMKRWQRVRERVQEAAGPLEAPAPMSIRQHTSAYVSIRQHTSAYVSPPEAAAPMRTHV
jgi:hypothetical protein